MNAKQVFAALSIAIAGNAAMAVEAEQYTPAPSTLTRAEVQAAKADEVLMSGGEATVFVDRPVASQKTREDVRAEARAAARDNSFDELNVA
ncbi:hypothetical protein BURC_00388 [Burkholderiaceae bacterium]|nr:hypothetical protein BURC_00388 [Burkholderiaceae bacterium]